jgi:predicted MFS family arabinose efflux permease
VINSPALQVANASARRWKGISPTVAFYLQASITMSFLAGSSAPTPLYPLYQAAWGFSPITITIIFGIYALAVLSALLVAGRLSDHVGRRPVLIAAALAQAVAMIVLGSADGVSGLLIGRIIQGLATGTAVAAVGAGLIDIDKARGTVANSIAPISGTALGGLIGGLMVHFLPAPMHLIYAVLGVVFVVQAAGVVLMSESSSPLPGALASLKPKLALPAAVRGPMLFAAPMMIAAWSIAGFYASLGPALIHRVFGFDASLFGGLALFLLAGSGGLAVLLSQRLDAKRMMTVGAASLLVGAAIVLLSLSSHTAATFFVGTMVSGMGFGVGFQGAIRMVVTPALPHERAGVLSVAFVISYLSMGGLAILAGFALVEGMSLLVTARGFGAMVMALAAFAAIGPLTRGAKTAS